MSGFCESEHQKRIKEFTCLLLLFFFHSPSRHTWQKVARKKGMLSGSLRGHAENVRKNTGCPAFRKIYIHDIVLRSLQIGRKKHNDRSMSSWASSPQSNYRNWAMSHPCCLTPKVLRLDAMGSLTKSFAHLSLTKHYIRPWYERLALLPTQTRSGKSHESQPQLHPWSRSRVKGFVIFISPNMDSKTMTSW